MNDYIEPVTFIDPLAGRYAGFWVKCAAPVIDLIVFIPLYYAIQAVCGEHGMLAETLFTIAALAAYGFFFASAWQASPGMYILGFYACDRDGKKLSFARAFLWGVVSMLGMALCCCGILYMQYRFDLNAVGQLLKSCAQENIRMEDCAAEVENLVGIPYETFNMMLLSSLAMALFLLLIWSLSVALARDKSGFHNLICHTRFVKGRL